MCSCTNSLQGFLLPEQHPACESFNVFRPVLNEAGGHAGVKMGGEGVVRGM